MPIDRCVCKNITLAAMKPIVLELRAAGSTHESDLVGQVEQRVGCGTQCGLCRPYIRLMVRTGDTEFAILSSREWDELSAADQPA